jgi:ABC-type bacteriocin/lantibiotic exporter with double-glycine peptidase domain
MATTRFFIILICLSVGCWLPSLYEPPHILAQQSCGERSLFAAATSIGLQITEKQVQDVLPAGVESSTFAEMQIAASQLNLQAEGRQLTTTDILRGHYIGVLHVDQNHFVALIGHDEDSVEIINPVYRNLLKKECWFVSDLETRWDGRILILQRQTRMNGSNEFK